MVTQTSLLLVYLKVSLALDMFGSFKWTLITFSFFTVNLYLYSMDVLEHFKVAHVEYYHLKVLKDAQDMKLQPFGALCFTFFQI